MGKLYLEVPPDGIGFHVSPSSAATLASDGPSAGPLALWVQVPAHFPFKESRVDLVPVACRCLGPRESKVLGGSVRVRGGAGGGGQLLNPPVTDNGSVTRSATACKS